MFLEGKKFKRSAKLELKNYFIIPDHKNLTDKN